MFRVDPNLTKTENPHKNASDDAFGRLNYENRVKMGLPIILRGNFVLYLDVVLKNCEKIASLNTPIFAIHKIVKKIA